MTALIVGMVAGFFIGVVTSLFAVTVIVDRWFK
jgi:ABC-type uncharacterized transport system permease subunit